MLAAIKFMSRSITSRRNHLWVCGANTEGRRCQQISSRRTDTALLPAISTLYIRSPGLTCTSVHSRQHLPSPQALATHVLSSGSMEFAILDSMRE